jgi:hypothetical protein
VRGRRSHELLLAQLTRNGAEDAGAARFVVVVEEHGGVLVEPDVGAVLAAMLLACAHDNGPRDLALLDVAAGDTALLTETTILSPMRA